MKSRQADKNEPVEDLEDEFDDSESRLIMLVGDFTESLTTYVLRRLLVYNERDRREPIRMVISTEGGSTDEAMAVYDAMKMSRAPIHTLGLGKVMSAGCLILASGSRGHRVMGRHAKMMYHAGTFDLKGDVVALEADLKEDKRAEKQYDKLVALETGMSLSQVEALYKQRVDRYIMPRRCKQLGFVDKLA